MRMFALTMATLCLLVSGTKAIADSPAAAYHVTKKIPLGGEGGWDYLNVDAAARRLYITRGNRVTVVDLEKGAVAGEIPNTPGVHGVALVPKRNRGFISNGGDATVTVFDLETLRQIARVKVGQRPDAIVYDPASDRVFTMNAGSRDATAIDTEKNTVAGTIKLGGRPEFAVADGEGHVYVNLEDKHEVLELDSRDLKVNHRWPIAPGKEPAGLAIDSKNRRLFSTCHNEKMVVLDADSGKVVATPKIGKGTDACIFDPDTGLAFSSNGDGTLTVVQKKDGDKYEVVANVPTEAGARTMALDAKTHDVYLVTARPKAGQRRSFEPGSFMVLVVGK